MNPPASLKVKKRYLERGLNEAFMACICMYMQIIPLTAHTQSTLTELYFIIFLPSVYFSSVVSHWNIVMLFVWSKDNQKHFLKIMLLLLQLGAMLLFW